MCELNLILDCGSYYHNTGQKVDYNRIAKTGADCLLSVRKSML